MPRFAQTLPLVFFTTENTEDAEPDRVARTAPHSLCPGPWPSSAGIGLDVGRGRRPRRNAWRKKPRRGSATPPYIKHQTSSHRSSKAQTFLTAENTEGAELNPRAARTAPRVRAPAVGRHPRG